MEEDPQRRGQPLRRTRREHPFLAPAVGFALGLGAERVLFATRLEAGLACLLALGAALLAARRGQAAWGSALLGLAGLGLGAFAALPLAATLDPGSAGRLARDRPGPCDLEGRIVSVPAVVPGRASFDVEPSELRIGGKLQPASGRLRLVVNGLPESGTPVLPWKPGDRVRASGLLRAPRDFATPGAGSRVEQLARQGVRALLVVKAPLLVEVAAVRPGVLWRLRSRIVAAIDAHVAGGRHPASAGGFAVIAESRAAAVLKAMLVDDRAVLDEEATRRLAEAGIIHVLSISGLHVAVMAAAAWLVAARLTRREVLRAGAALLCLWGYVLVAGLPAPALRSALVASVVLLGRALGREPVAVNSLALAFLLGGVLEPGGLFDPGFQATYAAAAGLLLLGPPLARRLERRLPRMLARALAASLAAELFVLPVALAHFGRVSWAGPVLNLAAVPLAALLLYLGLALPVADALHQDLAGVVGRAAGGSAELLFRLSEAGGLRLALRVATVSAALAAAAFVALVLAGWPGLPRPRWRATAAAILLALLFLPPRRQLEEGAWVLHVLDVGQGDALVVELPDGAVLLVDAGGFPRSRFDVGDRIVVPFLLSRGIRRLDLAVLSHLHPDHAAGMRAVLDELAVEELWMGTGLAPDLLGRELRARAARRGTRVGTVRRGEVRERGGVRIEVLNPARSEPRDDEDLNNQSIVLRLARAGEAVLLTGDIHAETEADLTSPVVAPGGLRAGVLKLAHHGSRTSSTEGFLDAVGARLAVLSCGFDNRFGHPDAEVLARLERAGIHLRRTDLDGTLSVTLPGDGKLRLETARTRFWRPPPELGANP